MSAVKHLKAVEPIIIRSTYSPKYQCGLSFEGEVSLTHQSPSAECDINAIMARYQKTGVIDHVQRRTPQYGDFSQVKDYRENYQMILNAQESFMALPAHVRARFENDPALFLDYVQNPENLDGIRQLGLLMDTSNVVPTPKGEGSTPEGQETP